MKNHAKTISHALLYLTGCFIIALGIILIIRSEIGTTPWDTLHVALSEITFLTIGQATIMVSTCIIAFVTIYERNVRLMAMGLSVFFVGVFIDVFDGVILATLEANTLAMGITLYTLGILVLPFGGAMLIVSKFPAGVLEEFMFSMMRVFKTKKMVITRLVIDALPVILGTVLSILFLNNFGTASIGTLIFVFTVGPCIKLYLNLFRRLL